MNEHKDDHIKHNAQIKSVTAPQDPQQTNALAACGANWGTKDEVNEYFLDLLNPKITPTNENVNAPIRLRYDVLSAPDLYGQFFYNAGNKSYAVGLKKKDNNFVMNCLCSEKSTSDSDERVLGAMIQLMGKLLEKTGGPRKLTLSGSENAIKIMQDACKQAQPPIEFEVNAKENKTDQNKADSGEKGQENQKKDNNKDSQEISSLKFSL